MNKAKLAQLESYFLAQYPQGFEDPELVKIAKKHNIPKATERVREAFRKIRFKDSEIIIDAMISNVSKSSMISLFEKPKYRDALKAMSTNESVCITEALRKQLHGNKQKGFNEMLDCLSEYKLAKWSLISILPFYFKPQEYIFVKPTTAKKILAFLEIQDIVYKPRPSWEFYQGFASHIDSIKNEVADSLSPNNAALTGFLMMSIDHISA